MACVDLVNEAEEGWTVALGRRRCQRELSQASSPVDSCALEATDAKTLGRGEITIDSGAAESVLLEGMLKEI